MDGYGWIWMDMDMDLQRHKISISQSSSSHEIRPSSIELKLLCLNLILKCLQKGPQCGPKKAGDPVNKKKHKMLGVSGSCSEWFEISATPLEKTYHQNSLKSSHIQYSFNGLVMLMDSIFIEFNGFQWLPFWKNFAVVAVENDLEQLQLPLISAYLGRNWELSTRLT